VAINQAMSFETEAEESPETVAAGTAHNDGLLFLDGYDDTEQTASNELQLGVLRRNARRRFSYRICFILLALAGACAFLFRTYEPFTLVHRTDKDIAKDWNKSAAKTAKRENATLCPLRKYPDTLVAIRILNNSHVLMYPGALVTDRKYFNCSNGTA
jgi:hypothetical protein